MQDAQDRIADEAAEAGDVRDGAPRRATGLARFLPVGALALVAALMAGPVLAAAIPLPPERPGSASAPSPMETALRMANGFAPFQQERGRSIALPDLNVSRASALRLQAQLTDVSAPLGKGVRWRVFGFEGAQGSAEAAPGEPVLLIDTQDAQPALDLAPGPYIVNCRFGAASVTRRVMVGINPSVETIVLDAGALRITSLLGPSEPVPEERVAIDIYSREPDLGSESRLVKGAQPGTVVRLPAGTYHVVSRYGTGNAVRRSKVRVDAGRLTDAQIIHAAAEISFKLVTAPGGEALAGTSWTVLTPGGDTVLESDGAYAGQVLAAGDYVAIARLGERIFNQPFTVQTGSDSEIEVVATR